jgi:hypothetical protein
MVRRGWLAGALIGTGVFVWMAGGGWHWFLQGPAPAVRPGQDNAALSPEERLEVLAPRQEPLHLIPRLQPYGPSLTRGQ